MQSRLRRERGAGQRDGGEQCRHTHAMQATGNALSTHWGAFAPSLLGGQALPPPQRCRTPLSKRHVISAQGPPPRKTAAAAGHPPRTSRGWWRCRGCGGKAGWSAASGWSADGRILGSQRGNGLQLPC